jgi:arginyl-tRNA synthetase
MVGEALREQVERVARELGGDDVVAAIQLERPRNPEHGDLATNVALVLAPRLRRPPRQVAELVLQRLDLAHAGIGAAEIAGPGFINFHLASRAVEAGLAEILAGDVAYGRSTPEHPRRVLVEFVSANPTGPLHVAHGRGAALGDAIASLLEWTGHDVAREFYVNDAGAQIEKLVDSIEARLRQRAGEDAPIPEGGYHGAYVVDLARDAGAQLGTDAVTPPQDAQDGQDADAARAARDRLRSWAIQRLLDGQKADLAAFGVRFDAFYSESRLYREGLIDATLADLEARNLIYEAEGARWLRTSDFGDDKDRVLIKSDGAPTYFLPDIAYHRDKARRGFDLAINIWGADHHGYVPRMQAALAGLGLEGFLEVEIVQLVRVMRAGREVRLSKRAGEFITLRDLLDETGPDVARYFFLMRRGDAQMVFDLDLALDQSEKNPVYKVQYAHARMMSIFRKAGVDAADIGPDFGDAALLEEDVERSLIKQLGLFPEAIRRAAEARAPHTLCDYLETTAGAINSWYHAGNPVRNPEGAVLVDDPALRNARLSLARAIQVVLRNGLRILGLDAPDRMQREDAA